MRTLLAAFLVITLFACSSPDPEPTDEAPLAHRTDSTCDSACDSSPLSEPVVTATGGYGAVTTYGNVTNPEKSVGGACNYGITQISQYAAAHVHLSPGDQSGLWQSGHACGDCYRVRVGGVSGWKTTVVRIVDKCPDAWCGIDLGGAPALALMGEKPGRYSGEWEHIPCADELGTSDGPPVLHIKEGSNAWWSLVQVRNGPSATTSVTYTLLSSQTIGSFSWATEAENFWKIPAEVLASGDSLELVITFRTGEPKTVRTTAAALAMENTDIPLP